MRLACWFFVLVAVWAQTAWGQDPVSVQAQSCFAGMTPRGTYPVVIALENKGASVDGVLVVQSPSFGQAGRRYLYPVSLPSGTSKRVVVYPQWFPFSSALTVTLAGPGSDRTVTLPTPSRSEEGRQVGLIGDQIGGLAFLRVGREAGRRRSRPAGTGSPAFNDCYARPEDAPERAAGYQALAVLVLSDGAERMNPAQWTAIRHWVMSGGSLVLLGGAGATYLRVGEAEPLVPLRHLRGVTLKQLRSDRIARGMPPARDVALTTGTPKAGAAIAYEQDGHVVLATHGLGMGTVLFVAFNPLDKPFRSQQGQAPLWAGLIRHAKPLVDGTSLQTVLLRRATSFERPSGQAARQADVDPFRVRLPPLRTVVWMFLAYFVLVVPVTFLVLKRLGRLEWAWVTSPLLSVAFAYGFYLLTSELYLAGLSRRTSGLIVAAAGQSRPRFVGFSEVFFPRGGSYKIEVTGAETLEMAEPDESPGYGSGAALQTLETVDLGTVFAPRLPVANLAFRRLYHTQPLSSFGAVTAQITQDANRRLVGTVHNGTGQALYEGRVVLPGKGMIALVGDLQPGETKRLGPTKREGGGTARLRETELLPLLLRAPQTTGGAIFVAQTSGAALGPDLGRDVGGERSVSVVVSLPFATPERKP